MAPFVIELPMDVLTDFCRRWKITRLEIFGSALHEDFGPKSDVDLLVQFAPDVDIGFLAWAQCQRELGDIRHLHAFLDEYEGIATHGVLLHTGTRAERLSQRVWAIPLALAL